VKIVSRSLAFPKMQPALKVLLRCFSTITLTIIYIYIMNDILLCIKSFGIHTSNIEYDCTVEERHSSSFVDHVLATCCLRDHSLTSFPVPINPISTCDTSLAKWFTLLYSRAG